MKDQDRPRTLACSCRALDPMEELVAAMVNLAINDGLQPGWEGAEARHWVRTNVITRWPQEGPRIERWWEYPYCRCGRRAGNGFSWPDTVCPTCRAREEEKSRQRLLKEERGRW